ncbi:MAG: M55 family metallopeptidase [Chitinophagaceae bacterium]|nr:M55 family metallopeptidase [Chitinophagaceae bacterium]
MSQFSHSCSRRIGSASKRKKFLISACIVFLISFTGKSQKIYIITDLEGASGVYKWSQIDNKDDALNREACEYYMKDLEAVVKGFKEAGANEVFVFDAHGLQIIIPHLMTPGAKYLTGHPRPYGLLGLDSSFSGVALIGFHAMEGTENGVLNHTQNPENHARYWYNGVESGEIAQDAAKCGFFGVPVIMVSGDDATCREATRFLGKDVVTVTVKEGIAEECAVLYPLEETYKALFNGAKKAMTVISKCKPYVLKTPIHAKKVYYDNKGLDPRFPIPVLKTTEWIINSEPEFLEY